MLKLGDLLFQLPCFPSDTWLSVRGSKIKCFQEPDEQSKWVLGQTGNKEGRDCGSPGSTHSWGVAVSFSRASLILTIMFISSDFANKSKTPEF